MSELESRFVKQGYWVNNAHGSILGQTITTDSRSGALVVALLAVITSLGLTHLWHLLTFLSYQFRASGIPKDGLFRQQQALLRTLPTPSTFTADLVKIWFAWRKVSRHALYRSTMGVSIASVYIAGSLVVSIFSSYVVSSVNLEVLVSSPYCGKLDSDKALLETYYSALRAATESYGPECYRNASLPSRCNIYTRPSIPFITESTPCPFDEQMCTVPAIALDSGLVDMGDAFGLNIDEKDRVQYRRRTSCTILPLEGYTEISENSTDTEAFAGRAPLPNERFLRYFYGTSSYGVPFTFSKSFYSSALTMRIDHLATIEYALRNTSYQPWFRVDPKLHRDDADVNLRITFFNRLRYNEPVNDPLFSAHQEFHSIEGTTGDNVTAYGSDELGRVIGCAEQYQYCLRNASAGYSCTGLDGLKVLASNILPEATKIQRAIIELLDYYHTFYDISRPGRYKAQEELVTTKGVIPSLPNDQWIQELQSWESIIWAIHQVILSDYAIGPAVRDPLSESLLLPAVNETEKRLCGMQKMRKPGGFVNINVFGLVFTITICGVITLTDLLLLRTLLFWSNMKKSPSPRLNRWMQDGVYQLQRRAYESSGHGIWEKLDHEVPVTNEDTMLPDLPMETLLGPVVQEIESKPSSQTQDEEIRTSPAAHDGRVDTSPTQTPEGEMVDPPTIAHNERSNTPPTPNGPTIDASSMANDDRMDSARIANDEDDPKLPATVARNEV